MGVYSSTACDVDKCCVCVCGVGWGSEAASADSDTLGSQILELRSRNDVLLELLGEKEEEIEELRQDHKDAEETYRIQLDELMTRLTAQS